MINLQNKITPTKDGVPLDPSKYTIDTVNKVFESDENGLVLDCPGLDGWTFNTGDYCTFITGWRCEFGTGSHCIFKTGAGCLFNTGYGGMFRTGFGCVFETSYDCTFTTGSNCTFRTGKDCVIVKRDEYEVIEVPVGTTIKLNDTGIKGFTEIRDPVKVTLDDETKELSEEDYEKVKELFDSL
jgi:hypothetical protein